VASSLPRRSSWRGWSGRGGGVVRLRSRHDQFGLQEVEGLALLLDGGAMWRRLWEWIKSWFVVKVEPLNTYDLTSKKKQPGWGYIILKSTKAGKILGIKGRSYRTKVRIGDYLILGDGRGSRYQVNTIYYTEDGIFIAELSFAPRVHRKEIQV